MFCDLWCMFMCLDMQWDPQVGLAVARSVNVSVSWAGIMRKGLALSKRSSYLPDAQGWPYQYQVHPLITGVSPATGSLAGGTLVTILGSGFPVMSPAASDESIEVQGPGGVGCDVLSSNGSQVTCVMQAQAQRWKPPVGPTAAGLVPGMRGILYQYFPTT